MAMGRRRLTPQNRPGGFGDNLIRYLILTTSRQHCATPVAVCPRAIPGRCSHWPIPRPNRLVFVYRFHALCSAGPSADCRLAVQCTTNGRTGKRTAPHSSLSATTPGEPTLHLACIIVRVYFPLHLLLLLPASLPFTCENLLICLSHCLSVCCPLACFVRRMN